MSETEVSENVQTEEQEGTDREKELLEKISALEIKTTEDKQKNENSISSLQKEIQSHHEERENLKNKINLLEAELLETKSKLSNNVLSPAQQDQIDKVKQMSEEMLTRAKGVIFDKTKICKNQELQIEALNAQVSSLKEVLTITKELLEIRNVEVTHLQSQLNCMEQKINAEHERRDLMDKKLDAMVRLNQDLKDEYQIQLRIFNALKVKYNERDLEENKQKEQ